MLWNLEPFWLMMAIAAVAVAAFMFGSALHAIMKDDGFGATGNMALFMAGFFAAVIGANHYGVNLRDLTEAVAWGLGGAFGFIAVLALLKAGARRMV